MPRDRLELRNHLLIPLGNAGRRLVLAVILLATVGACGSWGFGEGGDGLTPKGTAEGYLDASVAGDCRAASRLSTPDLVRQGLWCENPRVLSYGEIGDDERRGNEGEVVYPVEAVVIGGTGLEQHGLRAGANSVLVQLLRQPDGKWRVNAVTPRP